MKKVNAARKNKQVQVKHTNPGRPRYTPSFPRGKEWTFTDFMLANDININADSKDFGKGPNCTMLTLRKFMARDMFLGKGKAKRGNPRSMVVSVSGVTAEPNSDTGLGRRALLYSLRNKVSTKRPRTATVPVVAVNESDTPTADALDDLKKTLLAPVEAVIAPMVIVPEAVTIPAVTIVPESMTPEVVPVTVIPASAPVDELVNG